MFTHLWLKEYFLNSSMVWMVNYTQLLFNSLLLSLFLNQKSQYLKQSDLLWLILYINSKWNSFNSHFNCQLTNKVLGMFQHVIRIWYLFDMFSFVKQNQHSFHLQDVNVGWYNWKSKQHFKLDSHCMIDDWISMLCKLLFVLLQLNWWWFSNFIQFCLFDIWFHLSNYSMNFQNLHSLKAQSELSSFYNIFTKLIINLQVVFCMFQSPLLKYHRDCLKQLWYFVNYQDWNCWT